MQGLISIEQFKNTVYEQGYGTVAKKVMQDKSLSVGAKALYAYLCSYAWGKDESYPTVQSITDDLGISEKSFARYRKELEESGYITVTFRNIKGQNRNVYTLNSTPVKSSGEKKTTPSKSTPVKNDPPIFLPPNNKRNTLQDKKVIQDKKIGSTKEKNVRNFIDESDISENLKETFHKFVDHRKEIGKMFKTANPVRALIRDLRSNKYMSEEHLIECINIAIDKEYQGVFPSYSEVRGKKKDDKFRRFAEL